MRRSTRSSPRPVTPPDSARAARAMRLAARDFRSLPGKVRGRPSRPIRRHRHRPEVSAPLHVSLYVFRRAAERACRSTSHGNVTTAPWRAAARRDPHCRDAQQRLAPSYGDAANVVKHTFLCTSSCSARVIDSLQHHSAILPRVRALTIHHRKTRLCRCAKSTEKITDRALRVATRFAGAYTLRTRQGTGCTQENAGCGLRCEAESEFVESANGSRQFPEKEDEVSESSRRFSFCRRRDRTSPRIGRKARQEVDS